MSSALIQSGFLNLCIMARKQLFYYASFNGHEDYLDYFEYQRFKKNLIRYSQGKKIVMLTKFDKLIFTKPQP